MFIKFVIKFALQMRPELAKGLGELIEIFPNDVGIWKLHLKLHAYLKQSHIIFDLAFSITNPDPLFKTRWRLEKLLCAGHRFR